MAYGAIMARLSRWAGLRVFRVYGRALEREGPARRADLQCRMLYQGEVLAQCVDASLELSPGKVMAAYARGDLCVAAFEGSELVGYCWFAFAPAPHMDRAWIEFAPDVVYVYKSYVRPAFRGRGIAAALYRLADELCMRRGRERAVLCVESHNRPSMAAAARSGFRPVGYAVYLGGRRLRAWSSYAAGAYRLRFFVPQ